MSRQVVFGQEVQKNLLEGVNILANAVGSTLGPMGRNVVIETPYGATTVTKDGVTVAKLVDLEHPIQNLAAQILKQAAARTAVKAGDGTTTATVIAQAIIQEAQRMISAGVPPISIKRDLESFLNTALNEIHKASQEVSSEKIVQIATIASNNDSEIGELIAAAYEQVGKDGVITLEESKTGETTVDLVDGMTFERGYASPYFVTDPAKNECVLENPLILLTDKKLNHTGDLVPIMEKAIRSRRPLFIIADEIEGQALQLLALNKMQGVIQVCAIRSPSFGERRGHLMEDIAALTSGIVISDSNAQRIENTTIDQLGTCEKVIVGKTHTIIVQGKKDEERINARVQEIRGMLAQSEEPYATTKLQERLASLIGKIGVLKVGASTDTEMKEKKDRIDDALRATSCAIQKGFLVGGGAFLARLAHNFSTSTPTESPFSLDIFKFGLQAPLKKIAENAGASPDVTLDKVISSTDTNFGYNARTHVFENLIDAGVIDPTLVVEQALVNAISAANMILLSGTAMYNTDRKPPFSPGSMDDFNQAE